MPASVQAEWALNLQRPVTEIARVQYDLHMLIMYIVTVIGVIVFAVMFYSIVKFRKSKGAQPAKFSHSTKAEVIWTVIPTLILIVMAVPSTKALLLMEDTTEAKVSTGIAGGAALLTWDSTLGCGNDMAKGHLSGVMGIRKNVILGVGRRGDCWLNVRLGSRRSEGGSGGHRAGGGPVQGEAERPQVRPEAGAGRHHRPEEQG